MNTYRSGGGGGVIGSHTSGDMSGLGTPGNMGKWMSPTRFLVASCVVVSTVVWFIPTMIRAREPAHEADCLAHLKQVGYAMTMYAADNTDHYPLIGDWHQSVRIYIDNPDDPHMRVMPGSKRDPLKCPSDPSSSTVSFLYLSRKVLAYNAARLDDVVTPLAVDEYFHRKTTLVYYDGHVDKIERPQWAYQRQNQWMIRRDLNDAASFAYELVPGTQVRPNFAAPVIEPTERYIWPEF